MAKIAQNWLEEKYKEKNNTTVIGKEPGEKLELEGELKIDGYPNLKKIFLGSTKGITKLTITNCPEVEVIFVSDNQITQIDGLENLKELKKLNFGGNKIEKIDISENIWLEMLILRQNPIDIAEFKSNPKEFFKLVHWNSDETFPLLDLFEQASRESLQKMVEKLKLNVEDKISREIEEMIVQEIGKLILIKAELKYSFPGLVDDEEEIDQTKLGEIVEKIEKIKELVTNNPDLTTDNVIDQAKINDLKNAIKGILNIPLTDSLTETWKTDLKTKLDELEKRPTQEQLDEAVKNAVKAEREKWEGFIDPKELEQTAKDKLGMVSKTDHETLKNQLDARPNITKEDWENDYSQRPKKSELDQANQKLQGYENGLKTELELNDDALPNWKDEIKKLKNRPTSDNSEQIKNVLGLNPTDNLPTDWPAKLAKKDDLKAAQNSLKEWTDKFQGKSPDEAKKEVDNLQKELDDWKKLGETPKQVENEIKELKDKPTGGAITQEEYDKVVRQRDARANITHNQYDMMSDYIGGKMGTEEWQDKFFKPILGENWEAEVKAQIEQVNKQQ